MPVAEALRSQLAWSSKNASKSANTASSHAGGVETRKSSIRGGGLYLPAAVLLGWAAVAGYSGTPLPKKLGIKPGAKLAMLGAPADFTHTLGELPAGVAAKPLGRSKGPFDVIVAFFEREAAFKTELPKLHQALEQGGGLW